MPAKNESHPQQQQNKILINVTPATGGPFQVFLPPGISVEHLKAIVAGHMEVPNERFLLFHKDRVLNEGTLQANNIVQGSQLFLIPTVASGRVPERPDEAVMRAVEALTDSQIDEFLTGKGPLLLYMAMNGYSVMLKVEMSKTVSTASSSASRSAPKKPRLVVEQQHNTQAGFQDDQQPGPSRTNDSGTEARKGERMEKAPDDKDDFSFYNKTPEPKVVLDIKALNECLKKLPEALEQLSVVLDREPGEIHDEVMHHIGSRKKTSTPQPNTYIESVKNLGQSAFSGTFAGTLTADLKDISSKRKRDTAMVIQILNDLLHSKPYFPPEPADSQPDSAASEEVKVDVEKENGATKAKLEHLRKIMEQNRAKRQARREGKIDAENMEMSAPVAEMDFEIIENAPTGQEEQTDEMTY